MTPFPVRVRGYDRASVDEMMRRIEGTLGREPLLGPTICSKEVRDARFRVVVRGYDVKSVDEALLERVWELEEVERGPAFQGSAEPEEPREASEPTGLIVRVRSASFDRSRLRPGYDERDVDAFLSRVTAGLEGSAAPVSAADVRACVFRTVRLASGYDMESVDAFLDALAAELDGLDPH